VDAREWEDLWTASLEVSHGFEPGAVFIGGVAVFAHTRQSRLYSAHVAFSHDADLLISVSDYTDLKDIEQVTPNRRLQKCQFYKRGFEFDVYVEGQHGLVVPYDEASAYSVTRAELRVACLEHLVILKMKAFEDRRGSAKGMKDEDDLFKLLLLVSETTVNGAAIARLDDRGVEHLQKIPRSDAALRSTAGNKHFATKLREAAERGFGMIADACNTDRRLV